MDETKAYRILPDGTVNESLIEGQWEDMLRLMVSLKLKQVTAWQVLKRLSAYTRQHTSVPGAEGVRAARQN